MTTKNELNICIAQIEVVAGQPSVNTKKMLDIIVDAKSNKADLVVFPEMAIPGYLLGDMWERPDFLEECERCGEEVIAASKGISIAFGNVQTDSDYRNEDGRIRKYNACYIATDGQLLTTVVKTLQPNYREFDDNRHFYDKRKLLMDTFLNWPSCSFEDLIDESYQPSIKINDLDIGFLLCEDSWNTDYTFSPIDVLAPKCDIVVNISCSPFTMGKNDKRSRIFSEKAAQHNTSIVYVNNVGIQNNGKTIYTFDGNSCIYDRQGNMKELFDDFEEEVAIMLLKLDDVFPQSHREPDNIETVYNAITYGIKKFLEQIGVKRVVVGASGGIDSAVVAALMSKVLDSPKDLHLINMPSKFNSQTTKDLAKELAENLGCHYNIIPIGESIELTRNQLIEQGFIDTTHGDVSSFVFENIQARDRSSRVLAAVAASVRGVFTCNANKSEATVGYTTLYGDLGGFMAPIIDLWKTDVYELANYINNYANDTDCDLIPEGILNVKPSAELNNDQNVDEGKGDPLIYEYHDKLFASWVERWDRATPADILQWYSEGKLEAELGYDRPDMWDFDIVEEYFNGHLFKFIEDLERWWNLYDGFAYAKRIQAPPALAVSRRSYGFDLRESQTAPFYSKKYYELRKKIIAGGKLR